MFFKDHHNQGKTLLKKGDKSSGGGKEDSKKNNDEDKDIDQLKTAMAEVNKTLVFIKAVVSKGKLEVLPGSASVILETVMHIFNLLRYPQHAQESNSMMSSQSKVCQHLAQFIQWTDDPIAGKQSKEETDMEPAQAGGIIDSLLEGIEELTQLGLEKMSQKKSNLQLPASNQQLPSPTSDGSKNGQFPEIPLTPREQEILAQTGDLTFIERGSNSSASTAFSFDSVDGIPPPKPPHPRAMDSVSLQSRLSLDSEKSNGVYDPLIPPPLPEKRRSTSSSVDMFESLSGRSPRVLQSQSSVSSHHSGSPLISSTSLDSIGLNSSSSSIAPPSPSPTSSQGNSSVSVMGDRDSISNNSNHHSASDLSSSSSSSSTLTAGAPSSSLLPPSSFQTSSAMVKQQQHLHQQQQHLHQQQIQQKSSMTTTTQRTVTHSHSDSKMVSSSRSTVMTRKPGSGMDRAFEDINQLTNQIKRMTNFIEEIPPPLPAKKTGINRLNSQYDNVPPGLEETMAALSAAGGDASSLLSTTAASGHQKTTVVMRKEMSRISSSSTSSSQSSQSNQSQSFSANPSSQRSFQTFMAEERASSHETYSSSETFSSNSHSSTESLPKPPPLPPKQKHVQAYIQTFGSLKQPGILEETISRHSINFYEAQWHQHQRELFYPRSNTISFFSDISSGSSVSGGDSSEMLSSPASIPPLPDKMKRMSDISHGSQASGDSSLSDMYGPPPHAGVNIPISILDSFASQPQRLSLPLPLPKPLPIANPSINTTTATTTTTNNREIKAPEDTQKEIEMAPLAQPEIQKDSDSDFCELNLLDDLDISDQLIFKAQNEEGPPVKGGAVDALIVHATQAGRIGSQGDLDSEPTEFMYQEAFLTTYRMFISPKTLMEKLLYRFHKFHHSPDNKKKLAHNSFSLLIRVVDEMGMNELDSVIVNRLMSLIYELISEGALNLARLLRRKFLEKCEKKQTTLAEMQSVANTPVQSSIELSSNVGDLLNFKAHDIAEQMTLLDSQLFQKLEIPEVLMWAKEQSEENSPNLTKFTEHFNKMSYWCRTKILTQDDPKEREKYFLKFIKIMRHLRKLHNFNSYLAVLSALDSAPVRRLEWQKQNMDALQEFCQLIDSSSSFRVYRNALSETDPPCIPYLGLILQDLTFINIGNQDKLPDGSINFTKHWQQFNILDSVRRFRTCCYQIKRSDKVMNMLNNFEGCLNEDRLWQISQNIKPRPTAKSQTMSN